MTYRAKPAIMTSVKISPEFYEACKKLNIKFSEAMRVGISLLLAERGIQDYDNNLNLVRQRTLAQEKLREVSQKYFDLLEKSKKMI